MPLFTTHVLSALNPTAGSGMAQARWERIARLMEELGITWDFFSIPGSSCSKQLQQHLDQKGAGAYGAIVGIGGDGTHSSMISALMRYQSMHPTAVLPPYAMIPLGTGNSIAKSFGLSAGDDFFSAELRRAVAAIRYGADYRMDLGRVDDTWFCNSLTMGLDSQILQEHNRHKMAMGRRALTRRWLRGNVLYTWCAGASIWRQKRFAARIEVDGRLWHEGSLFNLVINNTRVYAGEFVLCPDAFANDGLMEVVAMPGPVNYLAKYLFSLRHNPRKIQVMPEKFKRGALQIQGRQIKVELAEPASAQYDGEELAPRQKLEIEVLHQALRVRLPAEPA